MNQNLNLKKKLHQFRKKLYIKTKVKSNQKFKKIDSVNQNRFNLTNVIIGVTMLLSAPTLILCINTDSVHIFSDNSDLVHQR